MSTRSYDSPARTAAAAEKRTRVVAAATALLREGDDVTAVSLEAVARAAGVTRLTVYNQFGSRRGLLEAVLEQLAHDTGMDKVAQVIASEKPRAALDKLIDMICHAWGYDESMGSLQAAALIDPEFAEVINARVERRRGALRALVTRLRADKPLGEAQKTDLVDLLFAQTAYPVFVALRAGRRTPEAVAALMKYACHAALAGADKLAPVSRRSRAGGNP